MTKNNLGVVKAVTECIKEYEYVSHLLSDDDKTIDEVWKSYLDEVNGSFANGMYRSQIVDQHTMNFLVSGTGPDYRRFL